MFQDASVLITGGNFYNINYADGSFFKQLHDAAVPAAFGDSGDQFSPPKCHPHTRLDVLKKVRDWARSEEGSSIMWMHGSAGIGKSAIAQTVAVQCAEENRLLASFVFSRFDPLRNNGHKLASTITYQTAVNVPATRPQIEAAIANDPLILKRPLITQFAKLIIQPLRQLVESGDSKAATTGRLVILDGLDECTESEVQVEIVNVLFKVVANLPLPLKFLIASRPEPHLTTIFQTEAFREDVTCLDLSLLIYSEDIRLFLEDKFHEIKRTHRDRAQIPSDWPSSRAMGMLLHKSSGHFIYASTVIEY
ncbi:hypothetical protein BDZ97DRAFT_1741299, partial [Flammula alnicola]